MLSVGDGPAHENLLKSCKTILIGGLNVNRWNVTDRGCFELFCLIQAWAHGFPDQTDQHIGRSIRQKRPIQRNAKMEMKTSKYNWASKLHESQNRVGRGHCWRCGCEGIKCPAAGYEKARTRPHSNPVFHAAAPAVLWFNSLTNSSEFQTNRTEILSALQLQVTCTRSKGQTS